MAVEIQKTLCGGRNTENLIKSTCFYLKNSQVDMFCLNFSQLHIFCDNNRSKLVLVSTHSGVWQSCTLLNTLHEKSKIEDLIIKQKVWGQDVWSILFWEIKWWRCFICLSDVIISVSWQKLVKGGRFKERKGVVSGKHIFN